MKHLLPVPFLSVRDTFSSELLVFTFSDADEAMGGDRVANITDAFKQHLSFHHKRALDSEMSTTTTTRFLNIK